jgi:MFS family permease
MNSNTQPSLKEVGFVLRVGFLAFATYSCMYAFRKAFSVGIFEGEVLFGMDFKSVLIISQVLGYTLSKFIGIKIISELKKDRRAIAILLLIAFSELALILFAYIPAPYNFWCLFLNGLPLGMIWGIVFSYLEGRSTTEILGAMLTISFILASNIAKSVAQWLMLSFGTSAYETPYLVGLMFSIPLIMAVYFLDKTPEPSESDRELRLDRKPMDAQSRKENLKKVGFLMGFLVVGYVVLTIFRDLTSNYASDIWLALGYQDVPSIYVTTSLPATIIVLVSMGFFFLIKNNLKALQSIMMLVLAGFFSLGLSTFLLSTGQLDGVSWVIIITTGTYLAYIPFNCFIFERMIPAFQLSGSNVGFLIYIADSFGYLGSVGALFYKNFVTPDLNWYHFILGASYVTAAIGILFSILVIFNIYKFKLK